MTAHQGFETAADALTFIFGGNATFTISSSVSGDHFTFKCRQKAGDDGKPTPFFVSVLNGPDVWTNFRFIGFIKADGADPCEPTSALLAGRKGSPDAPSFKALSWVLAWLNRGEIKGGLKIQHEGKCCRCARKLTVPSSIEAGIGPDCAQAMGV